MSEMRKRADKDVIAFEAGKIKNFVEVDPNCNFIRVGG